jgi:hypothetical protein
MYLIQRYKDRISKHLGILNGRSAYLFLLIYGNHFFMPAFHKYFKCQLKD